MTPQTEKQMKSTLKEVDEKGLSREVEESIEARLGAEPSEEE